MAYNLKNARRFLAQEETLGREWMDHVHNAIDHIVKHGDTTPLAWLAGRSAPASRTKVRAIVKEVAPSLEVKTDSKVAAGCTIKGGKRNLSLAIALDEMPRGVSIHSKAVAEWIKESKAERLKDDAKAAKAEAAENVAEAEKAEAEAKPAKAEAKPAKATPEKPMPAKGKANVPSVGDVYEAFAGLSAVQMAAFLEKAAIAFAATVATVEEKPRADTIKALTTAAAQMIEARDELSARLLTTAEAA